eukprot:CAMPEP_0197578350 /NCGR_PEP_ID=MMETSP1326-20131121/2599_1 /TAXON_ID=1155430 /ORGANISM="Genus nov. species nov., Strain RCC2288" /LENGTH=113 /DNA_ID=CAMNT_0043141519 /DNA_START=98 /DNA_END=435 /DNA_ORIENTATION=+
MTAGAGGPVVEGTAHRLRRHEKMILSRRVENKLNERLRPGRMTSVSLGLLLLVAVGHGATAAAAALRLEVTTAAAASTKANAVTRTPPLVSTRCSSDDIAAFFFPEEEEAAEA